MPPPVVITVARELGSGGSYIGKQVARRLGYAYIDREILQQAARELGLEETEIEDREERVQSFWDKLISVFALGGVDGIYTPPQRWVSDEQLVETGAAPDPRIGSQGALCRAWPWWIPPSSRAGEITERIRSCASQLSYTKGHEHISGR